MINSPVEFSILVVEDDEVDQRIIKSKLEQVISNFRVDFAESLSTANELLRAKKYDAIITDLKLPDSYDFEINLDINTEKTPLIVVSGYDQENIPYRMGLSGASAFVNKSELMSSGFVDQLLCLIGKAQRVKNLKRKRKDKILSNMQRLQQGCLRSAMA